MAEYLSVAVFETDPSMGDTESPGIEQGITLQSPVASQAGFDEVDDYFDSPEVSAFEHLVNNDTPLPSVFTKDNHFDKKAFKVLMAALRGDDPVEYDNDFGMSSELDPYSPEKKSVPTKSRRSDSLSPRRARLFKSTRQNRMATNEMVRLETSDPTHPIIIGSVAIRKSKYLAACFDARGSPSGEDGLRTIDCRNVDLPVITAIAEWLETSEITFTTYETSQDGQLYPDFLAKLYLTADQYIIPELCTIVVHKWHDSSTLNAANANLDAFRKIYNTIDDIADHTMLRALVCVKGVQILGSLWANRDIDAARSHTIGGPALLGADLKAALSGLTVAPFISMAHNSCFPKYSSKQIMEYYYEVNGGDDFSGHFLGEEESWKAMDILRCAEEILDNGFEGKSLKKCEIHCDGLCLFRKNLKH